jgi:hypothetical protein
MIFRLKATSPAINKAVNAGVTIDLDGKPKTSWPLSRPGLSVMTNNSSYINNEANPLFRNFVILLNENCFL